MSIPVVIEMLQWFSLAFMAFLLLGALHRIGMLEQRDPSSLNTLNGPLLGKSLGASTIRAIRSLDHINAEPAGPRMITFVSESCASCGRLLAGLERDHSRFSSRPIIVALQPSPGYLEALREVTPHVIADDGPLWDENRISATPTIVVLDRRLRVTRKEIGSDLSQVLVNESSASS